MEVAGLVLGVIGTLPVIIKVIEGYQIIAEVNHVKRHMETLGTIINNERKILNNTYEHLLTGIVPAWEIDHLRDVDPSTTEWQKYDDQIRSRLQGSYQDFQIGVKSIAEAIEDLKEKLAVTPSGEVQFTTWSSIVFELLSDIRVRTQFTLKRKEYIGTLSRIRENNSLLESLVTHSSAFESTRKANSRAKLARKVRILAQHLFSAFFKALSCRCADSHELGLHLVLRTGKDTDLHNGCVCFNIIFSTPHEVENHSSIWKGLNARWKEDECNPAKREASREICRSVNLLSLEDKSPSGLKEKSSLRAGLRKLWSKLNRSPSSSKVKPRAKVSFLVPAATTSTDEASRAKTGDSKVPEPITLSHITDICTDIQQVKAIPKQPVGFIPCDEKPKRFDLYYHDSMPSVSNTTSFTLREALSGKHGLMEFELIERFNIALTLSWNFLQLCNTPWLGEIISLDDILFLRAEGSPQCYTPKLHFPAPFLVRQSSKGRPTGEKLKPINFVLLSLGVLLTHVIMGRPVEDIDLNKNVTKERLILITKRAGDNVANCDDSSKNYAGAVQWCFNHCFCFETLEDPDLSRNFHDAVIAALERDLRTISLMSIDLR